MGEKYYAMRLWDMKSMIHCSLFIFFLGGLATINYYRNIYQEVASRNLKGTRTSMITNENTDTNATRAFDQQSKLKIKQPFPLGTCDLFSGRWVHDNKHHYPLYKENECPSLDGTFSCQTYGRNESKYLEWRWQPHSCDFPKFDGKVVVEKLRNKRLMFVGDSLNRNQWNSMICMLQSSIPGVKKAGGSLNLHTFKAIDYNISIDFYWAPMLVESNGDSPTDHRRDDRIFRLNTIDKHARNWVDVDILIFNSYHWWKLPVLKLVRSVGSLLDGHNQVFEDVDNLCAYEMGLKTWSKWVCTHIDPSKTKMFFMGVTATHTRAKEWRGKNHASCYGETEPVMNDGFWERGIDRKMLSILDSTLIKLKSNGVNVQLINVTQLTQCRKDAHTSIYRKQWRPLTEIQKKLPQRAADCSHWCLPGVPDIWNELLLAYIFR